MPNKITLKGFKEFEKKMKDMPSTLKKAFDGDVEDAAQNWARLAKRSAPMNVGFLKRGIEPKKNKAMAHEVNSNAEYSAYVEWGTGKRVRVPSELQAYAAQFKGKGEPGEAKKMIYEWARLKGIPKENWYMIYVSIMTNGIKPNPFFFVQIPKVEKELNQNLKSSLKKSMR